jgi:hypothetical protein
VDLAGLMLLHQLSQIESRLLERLPGQISTLLLKFSSPAPKTLVATVEMLTTPSSGCPKTKSLMRLAPSTEPEVTIMVKSAQP